MKLKSDDLVDCRHFGGNEVGDAVLRGCGRQGGTCKKFEMQDYTMLICCLPQMTLLSSDAHHE